MNREDFDKLVEEVMSVTGDLLISKGAEYAGNADRLANFKRNAEKNGQLITEVWKTYYGKHADAIDSYFARVHDKNLENMVATFCKDHVEGTKRGVVFDYPTADSIKLELKGGLTQAMRQINETLSEPIEGRFHDVINYSILCIAILRELKDGSQK